MKPADIDETRLSLSTIEIYSLSFSGFPLKTSPPSKPDPLTVCEFSASTTGVQLVEMLGEPDRKGGGESRSVGVWLEWTKLGLMCEFSGVHGQGRWDKEHGSGNATVSVWIIF